jgi:WD40 repeat protein
MFSDGGGSGEEKKQQHGDHCDDKADDEHSSGCNEGTLCRSCSVDDSSSSACSPTAEDLPDRIYHTLSSLQSHINNVVDRVEMLERSMSSSASSTDSDAADCDHLLQASFLSEMKTTREEIVTILRENHEHNIRLHDRAYQEQLLQRHGSLNLSSQLNEMLGLLGKEASQLCAEETGLDKDLQLVLEQVRLCEEKRITVQEAMTHLHEQLDSTRVGRAVERLIPALRSLRKPSYLRDASPYVLDTTLREPQTSSPWTQTVESKQRTYDLILGMGFAHIVIGAFLYDYYTVEDKFVLSLRSGARSADTSLTAPSRATSATATAHSSADRGTGPPPTPVGVASLPCGSFASCVPGWIDEEGAFRVSYGLQAIARYRVPNAIIETYISPAGHMAEHGESTSQSVESLRRTIAYLEQHLPPCSMDSDADWHSIDALRKSVGLIYVVLSDLPQALDSAALEQESSGSATGGESAEALRAYMCMLRATHPQRVHLMYEDYEGNVFPSYMLHLTQYLKRTLPGRRLLVHVHSGNGLEESSVMSCMRGGAYGVWSSPLAQAARIGHATSLMFLRNLLSTGNTRVREWYPLAGFDEAVHRLHETVFRRELPPSTPLFGEQARRIAHSLFAQKSNELGHVPHQVFGQRRCYRNAPLLTDVNTLQSLLVERGFPRLVHENRALLAVCRRTQHQISAVTDRCYDFDDAATLSRLVVYCMRLLELPTSLVEEVCALGFRDGPTSSTVLLSRTSLLPAGVLSGHHTGAVYCVALDSDGEHAFTGSTDGRVQYWSVALLRHIACVARQSEAVVACAVSPSGQWFSYSHGRDIELARIQRNAAIGDATPRFAWKPSTLALHTDQVRALCWVRLGADEYLISVARDRQLCVLSPSSTSAPATAYVPEAAPTGGVRCVARVHDAHSGCIMGVAPVRSVDGLFVTCGEGTASVRLWRLKREDGALVLRAAALGGNDPTSASAHNRVRTACASVAATPSVAVGDVNCVFATAITTLDGDEEPQRLLIAAGGGEQHPYVHLWQVSIESAIVEKVFGAGEEAEALLPVQWHAISPALPHRSWGVVICTSNDSRACTVVSGGFAGDHVESVPLTVWQANPASGELTEEFRVNSGQWKGVNGLMLSLDGTQLLSAAYDGTVRVWRVHQ